MLNPLAHASLCGLFGFSNQAHSILSEKLNLLISDRPVEIFNLRERNGLLSVPISLTKMFAAVNDEAIFDKLRAANPGKLVADVNFYVVSAPAASSGGRTTRKPRLSSKKCRPSWSGHGCFRISITTSRRRETWPSRAHQADRSRAPAPGVARQRGTHICSGLQRCGFANQAIVYRGILRLGSVALNSRTRTGIEADRPCPRPCPEQIATSERSLR